MHVARAVGRVARLGRRRGEERREREWERERREDEVAREMEAWLKERVFDDVSV